MKRPVTLFTGQWADLPLVELAPLAKRMGYDGLELACWGDHFEVDRAVSSKAYLREKWELLSDHGLTCYAVSNHLVGQAVCDLIDERHRAILPAEVWGDGEPEGVRRRAAKQMIAAAKAARAFFEAKPGYAKNRHPASQISVGEENDLKIRAYGELGGLEWRQQDPNTLLLKWPDRPAEILRTGLSCLGAAAAANTRLPSGHPEGFIEAFANIYRNFANHLRAVLDGRDPDPNALDYPKIADGIRGMAFIEAAVESSKHNARWTALSP